MLIHIRPSQDSKNINLIEDYKALLNTFALTGASSLEYSPPNKDESDYPSSGFLLSLEDHKVIGGVKLTPSCAPNLTFDQYRQYIFKNVSLERSSSLWEISDMVIVNSFLEKAVQRGFAHLDLQLIELCEGIILAALEYNASQLILCIDQLFVEVWEAFGCSVKRLSHPISRGKIKVMICLLDALPQKLVLLESYKKRILLKISNLITGNQNELS